ncbi:uncharacterized protein LOC135209645 [Macrobrachium nipponense]|uniref:uncharacterized protein LOC135209645 n=1 Tax=Macrobrachium nipponense TaxID=159736 RepID=UPI0030C8CB41
MASNQDEQEVNEDDSALQIVLPASLHFQTFQEYRRKELFTDLCIKCDGKLYAAHSLVVAASSPPMCKLLKSNRVQCRTFPRCTVDEEMASESFLSDSQKNQHQQGQQQTSSPSLSLIDVLLIDPAKKVSSRERQKPKKSGFSTETLSLAKKPNSNVDPARRIEDFDDAFDECCVIGPDKKSRSRIAMAVTVCGNGSLTLIIEGVDQEITELCIQLMYSESFCIKKCLVPKFISVSRSLELSGFESICQQLEMHLQGIPAFVSPLPLMCCGDQAPSTSASVKPLSPGKELSVYSDAETHSRRINIQSEDDDDVQDGSALGLINLTECPVDVCNNETLKQRLPKSLANEHQPVVPSNLSAKDELCMYMDQIGSVSLHASGTSDNGNNTPELIIASNSIIKEEDLSDVDDDDFSQAKNWCVLDENQTSIKDVPSNGQQCETSYISEVSRTAIVKQYNSFDQDSVSFQNKLCTEEQYLASEIVIKDEPVEECTTLTEEPVEKSTTLTELRAFRFKPERNCAKNLDAVMSECNDWTLVGGEHEKIDDHVKKQSEKNKILPEFETRGELEDVDIAQKQTVMEANTILNKDDASEIELGIGDKSSEELIPIVKEMDLKTIAEGEVKKKGLNATAEISHKCTDKATGTIVSAVHDAADSENKWQHSNEGDNHNLIYKPKSQDANEMGHQNQCVEATLRNEKQETAAFKSGKDQRIEEGGIVFQGTVSNECIAGNEFENVNKQRVCLNNEENHQSACESGESYCEVEKGSSSPIDVLKPRNNDWASDTESSETNSTVDTLENKVSILVLKGPIHNLPEFNSQERDLSFCETYIARENSDRRDYHQESLSFSDNSSGRFVISKEGQVGVCEVSAQDSECLSHVRNIKNSDTFFNKNKTSHLVRDDCRLSKEGTAFSKIKNKILKKKKKMFSSGDSLETVISGKLAEDTGTKFYVNHNSFKASCATFFTFKKRREKEIAAYNRKILKSASSFYSKRGGKLSLSQKNITFHSKLKHCKKIGKIFTRAQNSVSEEYQESVEHFTVMQETTLSRD